MVMSEAETLTGVGRLHQFEMLSITCPKNLIGSDSATALSISKFGLKPFYSIMNEAVHVGSMTYSHSSPDTIVIVYVPAAL